MKRSLLFAIVVLLIAALFVSCNANKVEEDQLGNVSISGLPRGLDVTGESDVDVENLYWYYSATKADGSMFRTGTTEWKAVKNGKGLTGANLGSFSTGAWTFCFYGYAEATSSKPENPVLAAVYYQTDLAATVVKNQQTDIVVTLTPGEGLHAPTFAVDGVTWKYDLAIENTALKLVITYDDETTSVKTIDGTVNDTGIATFNSDSVFTLDSGSHTLHFNVIYPDYDNQLVGVAELNVIAENGKRYTIINDSTGIGIAAIDDTGTVVISGSYDPNTGSATAKEIIETSDSGAAEFVTDITPATATEPTSEVQTTVSFPENTLVADSTYSLTTEVYPIETTAASSAFVVESGNTAAAAIDLILMKDEEVIHNFGNSVTVTSYVAKGLTSVNVVYNDGTTTPSKEGINAGGSPGSENIAAILDSDGGLGYNPATGYLRFTTTHFSVFAVGAEQNVYNKTNNTAYKLNSDGLLVDRTTEEVYNPDKETDELVLLDESKANDVADSIDAFNAGFKWTAIHSAAPTTDFAGGYGTKIEPYLIESASQMQAISTYYDAGEYAYYKIKESSQIFDASDWTAVNINGSFNGNGATFNDLNVQLFRSVGKAPSPAVYKIKNLTVNAKIKINGYGAAIIRQAGNNLVLEDVTVHGYIEGNNGAAAFVNFGPGNIADSNTQAMDWKFINCISDATIVATGDVAVGFVKHPYCYASQSGGTKAAQDCCLITIEDSLFKGAMYSLNGTSKHKYFVGNANDMLVKVSYSDEFIETYGNPEGTYYNVPTDKTADGVFFIGNYPAEGPKIADYSSYGTLMDTYTGTWLPVTSETGTLPDKYTTFTVSKANTAKTAKAYLEIGPNGPNNTGNYLGTFMVEDLTVGAEAGSITTSTIKYFDIAINGGHDETGLYENTFDVVSTSYGHSYGSAAVRIVQFNETGDAVKVTVFPFPIANN